MWRLPILEGSLDDSSPSTSFPAMGKTNLFPIVASPEALEVFVFLDLFDRKVLLSVSKMPLSVPVA